MIGHLSCVKKWVSKEVNIREKFELKSLKSQQYLRKVFKRYLGIIFSFLNALLKSYICHAARLSILFSPIQIFISKKMKIFILQIRDFQFVSSCFVLKITTVGPRYVRIRKKNKATFKWWHKKPPKQGCMQTLDKNYEMLKKAYV